MSLFPGLKLYERGLTEVANGGNIVSAIYQFEV